MSKFYITTPVYYVNDIPHIGHTYTTVAADILARYHRMIGDKTFFITGTDEHGAKIEEKAKQVGKEPQQFTDEISARYQLAWDELDISSDRFIRTTETAHIKAVQNALQYMYDKGDIVLGKYEGLYCRGCEQFKSERDLVNGLCPDHQLAPEKVSEECYSLNLAKYQAKLLDLIKKDKLKISPAERKNEMISFYEKEGLTDVSFSRKNVKWGIALPWDKSQTVYVWADAFLNYLTGLGWDGNSKNSKFEIRNSKLSMWPPDVQLMGKDILRVHATIWPAMLLALNLPLPKELFIHGYFLINGQKMSKSLGNIISPQDLIKKYGVDATRYLLASATPFGHDGDISWEKFDEKYNADLANGLGNLVARSITLAEKLRIIPQLRDPAKAVANYLPAGRQGCELRISKKDIFGMEKQWNNYQEYLIDFKIDLVLKIITEQIKSVDGYITVSKPWEMIKNNDKKTGEVIYNILESLRQLAWMLWPFMPGTADKIWESLGLDSYKEKEKNFSQAIKWGGLEPIIKVKKGEILFPRI